MQNSNIGWFFVMVSFVALLGCDGPPQYPMTGGDAGTETATRVVDDEPEPRVSIPRRSNDDEPEPRVVVVEQAPSPAPTVVSVVTVEKESGDSPAPASVVVNNDPPPPAASPDVNVTVEAPPATTVVVNMPADAPAPTGCDYDAQCGDGRVCVDRVCTAEQCTPGETMTCYLASGVRGEKVCAANGAWAICREVISANPQPSPSPAPAPTTVVTVVVESPPAPPPAPAPPVDPPNGSAPVIPLSECRMSCDTRGAECGFSESVRNLFCSEFCEAYLLTDEQAACLLDLPCSALPDLLDEDLRDNLVNECGAADTVIPPPPPPPPVVGDPMLPLAECLGRCIDDLDVCTSLSEDERDIYCSVICTLFDPRASEMTCMEENLGSNCAGIIQEETALRCFDRYNEMYGSDPVVDPAPADPSDLPDACWIQVESSQPMTSFALNYEVHDGSMYWQSVWCEGNEWLRNCPIPSENVRQEIDFWFGTGMEGAGSWSPGRDGETSKWSAYHLVTVGCVKDGVTTFPDVRIREYSADQVRFQFRTDNTALANLSDPNADSDGDSVRNADDCDPANASIRPPLPNESWENEICGNNIDENCDGSADVCAP